MVHPPVVVDASAWVAYFRRPDSAEGREVAALARSRRAALVGVVLAELLQGTRTEQEFGSLLRLLEALPFLETPKRAWREVGRMGSELRARGRLVPLTDLLVAATAMEHGAPLYTTDEHFARIPGLLFHRAG